jgi:hypothetical protein
MPFNAGVAQDDTGAIRYFPTYDVEYFPPGDTFLTLYSDIDEVDTLGNRTPFAPRPTGLGPSGHTLTWDEDLKLLWAFGPSLVEDNAFALEPTNLTTVAYGRAPVYPFSGTGMYDNVPDQTPILFVSGTCPGELMVTVADATPGDTVEVVSGTRRGRTSAAGGPCRGARADLANAQRRATLTADAYGIATTRVQATPAMCGSWMFQVLDMGSCLTTEVRSVPPEVVP